MMDNSTWLRNDSILWIKCWMLDVRTQHIEKKSSELYRFKNDILQQTTKYVFRVTEQTTAEIEILCEQKAWNKICV